MSLATLEQLYQEYKGTPIASFDGNPANNGQCVQWALMVRTGRDGLPVRYGNAIDWWNNRGADIEYYDYIPYAPGTAPEYGDYVVWGTGVGNVAGHIDLCAVAGDVNGFIGYDSNWGDDPILQAVKHTYVLNVLGFIRLKGGDTMNTNTPPVNRGDIFNMWRAGGMAGDPSETYLSTWDGSDWKKFMYDITSQGLWQQKYKSQVACTSDERAFLDLRKKI